MEGTSEEDLVLKIWFELRGYASLEQIECVSFASQHDLNWSLDYSWDGFCLIVVISVDPSGGAGSGCINVYKKSFGYWAFYRPGVISHVQPTVLKRWTQTKIHIILL